MLINLLQPHLSQKNTKLSANSFAQVSFKSLKTPIKAGNTLSRDVFESSKKSLREMLLDARVTYIKNNPEAFLTLDYATGIKELNRLKLILLEYDVYFKAFNGCSYIEKQMEKFNDPVSIKLF